MNHPIDSKAQPKLSRWDRLAWLPIPLLLASIVVARAAGLRETYESQNLTLVLSFTFYTMASLGTFLLIGRSFLATGSWGLLLLECGVILWGLAGTMGDIVSHGDANVNVTIFNTGILLAGGCLLAGAILSLRPLRVFNARPLWLGVCSLLALCGMGLVTWAALAHWLPVFFIPGQGGTAVRFWALISAISMFVLSAVLILTGQRRTRSQFAFWYAHALLLLAVGLFGVMIQLSLGSIVNWLGRIAQWLGGFYLFLAAFSSLQESQLPFLLTPKRSNPTYYRDAVAVVVVLATAAIRLTFLSAMGMQAPFVTFFPAVTFASIYGGLRSGLLATALSAILVDYFWVEPAGRFFMWQPADWLAMTVFLLSGIMIAGVSHAMHRARASTSAAENQALLAAERAAAAEALQLSMAEHSAKLEDLNKELESFTYSVSHDLRAPLRAIDGYSRMILKKRGDNFDEETKRQFDVIRNNTKMMGQLIDDLLAFSRSGRGVLSQSRLNMDVLTKDVWDELKANNPERSIDLKIELVPLCLGDRALIKQVLINLISNSVKFTKIREVPLIEVGGYEEEKENVYYVRDNGVGFDMKYYDKLFGVFRRLHSDSEYQGTGVGLAIVKQIITRHGGRVWAEGKVDEGATFFFTLPTKQE